MEEIWKDVVGYEGRYKVSNMGGVFSIKRGRQMVQQPDKDGYLCVSLSNGNGVKLRKVHTLVYEAFYGDRRVNDGLVVDHINSNRQDNRAVNLRLLGNVENSRRGRVKKSGLPRGVYRATKGGYMATIFVNGQVVYLGKFDTIEAAVDAYCAAASARAAGGQIKTIRQRFTFSSDGYKVCPCCGENKPITDFYRQGKYTSSKCKPCLIKYETARCHKRRSDINVTTFKEFRNEQ